MADAEKPRKKIGKYEIIEELGRGAMGVVYKAEDPIIGRLVALKTISPGLLDNPDLLKRFYREAQAAGGLQHPNIVIIYDLGEADGQPYIAMEFLEGQQPGHAAPSLEKIIANKLLMPLAVKLNHMLQLCRGLDFAHKKDLIHRDIKPGNIIVTKDDTVKVVDFGIVRLTSTSMTSTGMVIGTVGYMSPEQVRGEHVDPRSDLFSVGVVMYELFAYQKPFAGPNVTAVLLKIVGEEPPPLTEVAPQVPPELAEIVHKCLEKDPADRFQSLEDLALELEPLTRKLQRDQVDELVKQGQELVDKKDYNKAREVLRKALRVDSSHGLAKTIMGKVSAELKRMEVYPKVQALMSAGESLLKESKYEEAGQKFEEVLRLDSQHGQAQELLEKGRQDAIRIAQAREGLSAAQQALQESDLTLAQAELDKVFKVDEQNAEAKALLAKVNQELAGREKRTRLLEALRQGRNLLIEQRYQECVRLLEEVQQELKEFAEEPELALLLQSAREGQAEQAKRQLVDTKMEEARTLLRQQEYPQALATLDEILKAYPEETAAKKLRGLVLQEQKAAEREQKLEKELPALSQLIEKREFDAAVTRGERLHKEFPDDAELGRLLAQARAEKKVADKQRLLEERRRSVQELVNAKNFDQAVREAEKALKKFARDPELTRLLNAAKKARVDEKKHAEIENRIRAMKGAIERGDLTDALDLGRQTLLRYPEDTNVTQLVNFAQMEMTSREKKREREQQLKTAVLNLEKQNFDQATVILKNVEKEFPFDAAVKQLRQAAEAHQVLPDAGTLIGLPHLPGVTGAPPSAETQYVMQGPPATAASPATPTAGTQPQPTPPPPPQPEIKPPVPKPKVTPKAPPAPPVAKPAAKPAPAVEAPPAVKPVPKPAGAPPVAVPAEVAVPLWKKPAVMATAAVLVVGLSVGLYFRFGQESSSQTAQPATTPAQTQTTAPAEPPPTPQVNPAEQQQRTLIDEAKQLMAAGDFSGARQKLTQADQIQGGPLQSEITQTRNDIGRLEGNQQARQVAQRERILWEQAIGHVDANRFDRAEGVFRQILGLGEGGIRKGDARRYIEETIPQRKQEESNFAQAQRLAQQTDNENSLQQADRLLRQVIALGGPRLERAQQLQATVQDELTRLGQQRSAQEAANRVTAVERDIRADLSSGNFAAARQKLPQISQQGGDPAAITAEIANAERQKLGQLEGQFNRAAQQNDGTALQGLLLEFRKLATSGGPVASQAQDYIDNRIPQERGRIEKASAPPPREATITMAAAAPGKWTRPLTAGDLMGANYIDGGLQLTSKSVPTSVVQSAAAGSSIMLLLNIGEDGGVTGGRVVQGDPGVGQALLQAAQQSWRFNPPKVNGKSVKTRTSVTVTF
ncbi:MAG: protein kinase [Terriglobia bacterium]